METLPDDAALETFGPEIAGTGADRALHARAAVAATLVAALELSRSGALTLQQEAPWQSIQVRRHAGAARNTPPGPTEKGDPVLA